MRTFVSQLRRRIQSSSHSCAWEFGCVSAYHATLVFIAERDLSKCKFGYESHRPPTSTAADSDDGDERTAMGSPETKYVNVPSIECV